MTDQTTDDRCSYCGQPTERCAAIREADNRWMGLHAERADVVALRERQRQVRIAWGHESESGLGILRDPCTAGGRPSAPDDPDAVMRHQIARWRRGY